MPKSKENLIETKNIPKAVKELVSDNLFNLLLYTLTLEPKEKDYPKEERPFVIIKQMLYAIQLASNLKPPAKNNKNAESQEESEDTLDQNTEGKKTKSLK